MLVAEARPSSAINRDVLDTVHLARWLTCVQGPGGREHAVFSDGYRRIRIDVVSGSVQAAAPVILHYRLAGMAALAPRLLALRQLLALQTYHRFARTLFPLDPHMAERIEILRVADALRAGASQREIAEVLFGETRIARSWRCDADSLRSRVRRLVGHARAMAAGGYRRLLTRGR